MLDYGVFAYVFRSVLILLGQKQVSPPQTYGWSAAPTRWLGVWPRRRDRGEKARRSSSLLPCACEYKSPDKYLQVSMKLYTGIRLGGRRETASSVQVRVRPGRRGPARSAHRDLKRCVWCFLPGNAKLINITDDVHGFPFALAMIT